MHCAHPCHSAIFGAPEKVTDSDCTVAILRDMTFLTLVICPPHFVVFCSLVFCSLQRTCYELVIKHSTGHFFTYYLISSLFFSFINTFCNGRSRSLTTTGAQCKVGGVRPTLKIVSFPLRSLPIQAPLYSSFMPQIVLPASSYHDIGGGCRTRGQNLAS